jgi:tetratricopeptide (TPR) repeat protein
MRAPTLAVSGALVFAVAASFLSVPSGHTLLQLQLRDRNLPAAQATFEDLSAKEQVDANVLLAAARLYRELGDGDRAMALLEDYVGTHSDDNTARRLLADLYRESGMFPQYLQQLTAIDAATPDATKLAERAALLDVLAADTELTAALGELRERGVANADAEVRLAERLAAAGRLASAQNILLEVSANAPQAMSLDKHKLLYELLSKTGQAERGHRLALQWYGREGSAPDAAVSFCSWLLTRGDVALATALLEALTRGASEPGRAEELLLNAYLRAGQRTQALANLERWQSQAPLPKRLIPVWMELALAERQTKSIEMALPALRDMVAQRSGNRYWDSLYLQALRTSGRRDELAAALEADLAAPQPAQRTSALSGLLDIARTAPVVSHLQSERGASLSATDQRQLAFRLLEMGDKTAAIPIFMRLARNAPAHSQDVQTLLHLWGPRPDAAALAWLSQRAGEADATEQGAWLQLLVEHGAAQQVIEIVGERSDALTQAGRLAYLDALLATERWDDVSTLLPDLLRQSEDAEQLRRIAGLAEQVGDRTVVASAWRALLARKPGDPQALRTLAYAAYNNQQLEDADALLARLLQVAPADFEARYYQAEASRQLGNASLAQQRYETTLQTLDMETPATPRGQWLRALTLARLGRGTEAIAVFDKLRQAYPQDQKILEDYAAMLIEQGRAAEARRLLEQQGQGHDG